MRLPPKRSLIVGNTLTSLGWIIWSCPALDWSIRSTRALSAGPVAVKLVLSSTPSRALTRFTRPGRWVPPSSSVDTSSRVGSVRSTSCETPVGTLSRRPTVSR